ncbi:DUF4332 domain-containing protein [Halorubrum sp. JWXQ-INN 858]|uniref:DUF4332 domain-containing protein n=1 Tax=Halorubrum sp. JWXQ-INN 858 TaxID=2690782 RepID=UPI00135AB715|nr:DUF4332 domain-containing protein [Halorubrum sp. JWXQ-INN 858]MWV63665.1 DUF4332 domain-containing protein [Halorubrum sp. JWXQ-INN 858]
MSDRFEIDDSVVGGIGSFRLETLPQVETGKLDLVEKAAIERAVADREDLIQTYQVGTLELRSERNALASRLSAVESERDGLRERIAELEVERPSMEPRAVFESLGSAFDRADEELSGSDYRVEDVDFRLKANVIGTQEGVRMHLPSVDERSASANLSEVSFRLRAPRREEERRAEEEYAEIPDVTGAAHGTAARRLAAAGLDVGDVETVAAAGVRPNTVLEQFPEPFTVAPPGAPVDLVLSAEPDDPEPEPGAEPEPDDGEGDTEADDDAEREAEEARQEREAEEEAKREAEEAAKREAEEAAKREAEEEAKREAEEEARQEREAEEAAKREAEEAAKREAEEEAKREAEEEAKREAEEEAKREAEEAAKREAEEEARREREATDPSVDDAFLEGFRAAIERGAIDERSAFADRLGEAGLGGIEALVDADTDRLAKALEVPTDRLEPLHRELVATHGTAELESIGGIGPTYAGRLRDAGILTVGELARRDPREVAEITRASPSRAEGWIEEARSMLSGR